MSSQDSPAQVFSVTLTPEFYEDLDRRIQKAVSDALSLNSDPAKTTRYLTRKEVCELLNVSLPTLSGYIRKGLVPAQKIGCRVLIDRDKLNESLHNLSK